MIGRLVQLGLFPVPTLLYDLALASQGQGESLKAIQVTESASLMQAPALPTTNPAIHLGMRHRHPVPA